MPQYTWYCETCDKDTIVTRPMSESHTPPDDGCETCKGKVTKVLRPHTLGTKGFILQGGGWHDMEYTKTRSRN